MVMWGDWHWPSTEKLHNLFLPIIISCVNAKFGLIYLLVPDVMSRTPVYDRKGHTFAQPSPIIWSKLLHEVWKVLPSFKGI